MNKRILIIDDDPDFTTSIQDILEAGSYAVISAPPNARIEPMHGACRIRLPYAKHNLTAEPRIIEPASAVALLHRVVVQLPPWIEY